MGVIGAFSPTTSLLGEKINESISKVYVSSKFRLLYEDLKCAKYTGYLSITAVFPKLLSPPHIVSPSSSPITFKNVISLPEGV